ncbi:MAG TPA: hypothetical protein PK402_06080 [Tepidisphaeraceae bacterium]|nr:hypothetical protein [Tepidisphaeraceae bacterium]
MLLKPREVEAILTLAIDTDELKCYFLRFDEPRFIRGINGNMWLIDNDPHQPLPFDIGKLEVNEEISHLFERSY